MIYILVTIKDMFNCEDSFSEKQYPRLDNKETFIYFLKRHEYLEELTPLHSRARSERSSKMLAVALKHWLIPTDLVRIYYGDDVALYFEWMNHFISKLLIIKLVNMMYLEWLVVPGSAALVIGILNTFMYETKDSPFNSLYSIGVAIWATLFVIVKKLI
jgi:Calcium-activated chloride channel